MFFVKFPQWVVCCLLGVLSVCCCFSASAEGEDSESGRRILWISSYSSDDVGTEALIRRFREKLTEQGIWAHYESYDLAVHYQSSVEVAGEDIDALQAKLERTRYDLIVVLDTAAARLFLDGVLKAGGGTPILSIAYFGAKPLREIIPEGLNMTGVQTSVNFWDNVRLASRLQPQLTDVVLIVEALPGGYQPPPALADIPSDIKLNLEVLSGNLYTTNELMERIGSLPPNSAVFFQSWASVKELKPEQSFSVLPRIRRNFPGLILGKYDSYMAYGSMGGVVPNSVRLGEVGGEIACRILNGRSAASIPVEWTQVETVLDYPSLKALGLSLSALPPGAILRNEPPEFIIQYRFQLAVAAVAVVALLLLGLGWMYFRRLAQRKLEVIVSHLPLRIALFDRSERVLYTHVPDAPGLKVRALQELPQSDYGWVSTVVADVFAGKGPIERTHQEENVWRTNSFCLLPASNPFRREVVMCVSVDVTELHRANLAVEQIAERFRLTLESIGDGVIATDLDERITLINPVAAKLTGFTADEAAGQKMDDVFNIVSYLDGKPVESPLKKALRIGAIVGLANHTDLIARDGTRCHIADSAAPIRDAAQEITGGVLVFRDVTEEYRQRDQLRVHASLLDSAIRIARMTYFRADRDGRLIYASAPGFDDGFSLRLAEMMLPEDAQFFRHQWNGLRAGSATEIHQTCSIVAQGEKKYYEIRIVRLDNELSGEYEFCGVIQDITAAREGEMRYRDNLEQLETVIDNLPGFYFAKDVKDNFRYIQTNRTHEEVVGLPASRIIGSTDRELFALDDAAAQKILDEDRKLAESGGVLDTVDVFENHRNRRLVVRTIKKVIARSNGKQLMIGMGVDVTREYELEQEQRRTIETLNEYIGSERVVNRLLAQITLENDFNLAVNEMLRLIGENLGADRCYIFEYQDDELNVASNIFEWVSDGTAALKDRLQNVDMRECHAWRRSVRAHRQIQVPDVNDPPEDFKNGPEMVLLNVHGVKSVLFSGIWIDERPYGFVGIDFIREKQDFSECDSRMIDSAANLFQLAFERARQREQLLESVSMQRQIMDNISLPITIIGLDYTILAANPSAHRDAGLPSEKFIGTHCYDTFCGFGEPPEFCPVRETLVTRQPCRKEHDFKTQRQISTAQPIFDRNGEMQYILTADIDITELTRQKKELQVAMEQAQAADRAKSYFLATVSHELRTPLNAVIGFSELLQQGGVDPETQREYLHSINFAGAALLNLVNDVLDLSKLEAEQMVIAPARTDVADLVTQVAGVFKLKAVEKNLDLRIDVDGVQYMLYVDSLRLRQILLNLLGNAMKFTTEGFVEVKATFEPEPGADCGELCISVADSGIGISQESQKNIFDPFIQDNITRGKRVYEGSGLGLAITKRLLDCMDGKISLESEPGVGSVFRVRIDKIKYERQSPIREGEKTVSIPSAIKKRVLLVDDVPINLKVLAAMLRRLQIESVLAGSASEALEILRSDHEFDAVLTDIWMPEINGQELAARIAREPEFRGIPVAAVTADTQIAEEEKRLFKYILYKPITIDSLERFFKAINVG